MKYDQLIQLYFERSTALQWYWTIYVLIIGGLLAYSSFRQQKDVIKTVLVTVLFCLFAYKNLDAIHDVTLQRFATLQLIKEANATAPNTADFKRLREALEPTLVEAAPDYEEMFGVRNFHVLCDLLTIAALWVMERHRK
jgi:hypothetical protein